MDSIRLVDPTKYPDFIKRINTGNSIPSFFKENKWTINKIVLMGFIIFMIFFLYNCKYGIFRYDKLSPLVYT